MLSSLECRLNLQNEKYDKPSYLFRGSISLRHDQEDCLEGETVMDERSRAQNSEDSRRSYADGSVPFIAIALTLRVLSYCLFQTRGHHEKWACH